MVVSQLEVCQEAAAISVALNYDRLGLRFLVRPAASEELAVVALPAPLPAVPGSARRIAPEPEVDPQQPNWLAETWPTAATVAAETAVAAETWRPTPGSPEVQGRPGIRASAIVG